MLSPDGSQLAFKSVRQAPDGKSQETFVFVPVGGGEPKELCKCKFGFAQLNGWSKDGNRLFFTKWENGHVETYAVPAGGDTPEALGITPNHELHFLNLHPDGTQIVFSDEQWNSHLWAMKNLFPNKKAPR